MTRASAGRLLQVVGIAHGAIGAVIYRDVFVGIGRGPVVGSVPDRGDRAAAFWFMAAAPTLWLGGRLLRSAEEHGDLPAQRAAGAVLAAVGAVGTVAMPKSGFPSLVGIGGVLLRRSLRSTGT
ncbi:DUF6463 family protein [Streptomyces sp. SID5614]|uniref:DUF6463 family protein n=1 Tax=Streptomyces sp. SID5614 TaxID=2690306 RepID=UPI00136E1CCA|nr:DUF6463 family protein [Streptomyces sp. SID5614]MZG02143.1 hypothetical protein [Streptomyces sp. SID5614]